MFKKQVIPTILTAFLLAGCSQSTAGSNVAAQNQEQQEACAKILLETEDTVVIEAQKDEESFTVALEQLKKENLLSYSGTQDSMGLYLTEVNGVKANDHDKTYWALYTSLMEKDSVVYASVESGSFSYNGVEMGYSNFGFSSLPFVKGELYALVFEKY